MLDNLVQGTTSARTRFENFWLIVRDDVGVEGYPPEVLTLGDGSGGKLDGSILPVFSFEEEALLFLRSFEEEALLLLRLSGYSGRWRISKSGIWDLAWVLSDACRDIRRIALDPIPEIGPHGPHDLVSLSRKEFVELLVAGR